MDFELTTEQKNLRQQIIHFARRELNEGVINRDRAHELPRELWQKCGHMGLQGLPVPAAYGGGELDSLSTAIALEALGYACTDGGLVFSIGAHLLACVVPIWQYGSEGQKQHYLHDLCKGSLIAVNGMSEPDAGSDTSAMRTRAVPDGDGYRLSGTKIFSTNAPVGDIALVYAVTDAEKGYFGGQTAFIVDLTLPGVSRGQTFEKMGLRTSPIGELVFEDVFVPAAAVLGEPGAGAVQFAESMNWERVCLFASHVGTLQRLLETCINYARTRKQFGQAIGKFQAVSHTIADMKVNLEAARLLTYYAAARLGKTRDVTLDAAIAKLFVSESLVKAALETIQIFGGYGYMTEYEVERLCRDAIGSTIYSGTSAIQRNLIARWLGL